MSPQTEREFQDRLRALYRRTGDEVDTATAARLRDARRKALEAAERPYLSRWLVPAGAVAACLLAVVMIWPSAPHPSRHAVTPTAVTASDNDPSDALPPDPDSTDPALYEDMDFYAWLAQQPATASHTPRGG
ncbi:MULTISPECIES: hypothetical protein [Oleiagrimonas]|uniref:DUF3619 family protein n=1 Tax=Oleiagrimonas citrea TaxID=1665687 RepID=A0A846ZQ69_9GAMM|nr:MULTISPECIES: hypothetical protein [Oleiagrimonas]NKZ39720.1 hypothetical protein [Oleiagrimonas citrea]RAP59325.1 hypothetical protein BTJ49_01250 [Oleiagrimonas sp. MCCC 1A03011]